MIPISDHTRTKTTPFVTYVLLAVNIGVFLMMFTMSQAGLSRFIDEYAFIPQEIVSGEDLYTLFTSMFLHGGIGHIFGNMVFLNVFGDNLEDALGHIGYLMFYLVAGVGAAALQILVSSNSAVPNLGASGAIAGLLGGYLVFFPNNKVDVLVPLGYVFRRATVPAQLMLLYWIGFQFLQGIGSLGISGGGVAYFAHIGGFVAGVVMAYLFKTIRYRNVL